MGKIEAGYCKYESRLYYTLNLFDIARLGDRIGVEPENEARAAAKKQARRCYLMRTPRSQLSGGSYAATWIFSPSAFMTPRSVLSRGSPSLVRAL
jgi:hypothetical protein